MPSRLFDAWARNDVHVEGALAQGLQFAFTIGVGFSYSLGLAFVVHLAIRGYWVGLVGLKSTFPAGIQWEQTNGQRVALYPKMARLKTSADGAGLTAIARANGMSQAQIDACFASEAGLQPIMAMMQQVPAGVTGTPGFLINGKLQDQVYGWAALQPALRAAGAR